MFGSSPHPRPLSPEYRGEGEKCGKQKEASCRSTAAADVSASIRGKRCTAITTGCRSTRPGSAGRLPSEAQLFHVPFVFPAGRACHSFDELVLACEDDWEGARNVLEKGYLEGFLATLGRLDLAEAVAGPLALPTGIAAWTSRSAHCRTAFGRRPGCKSSRWR